MKPTLRFSLACLRLLAITGVGLVSFCLLAPPVLGQTDAFDDNNDNGWNHYNPLGVATFLVTNGTYRLQSPPNTVMPALGPARGGSLLSPEYADFYVSVDVVSWDDNIDQAFGILSRLTNPGLGTSTGYAFTYRRATGPTGGDLDISRITGEAPSGVTLSSGNDKFHFIPGQVYRMLFIGKGSTLEGRVYQLPELTMPVVQIIGTDTMYGNGRSGLVIYDPVGTLAPDATFDNYFAATAEPPRLDYSFDITFNELQVSWLTNAATFQLQFATNLSLTPIIWRDVSRSFIFPAGDRLIYTEAPTEPFRTFRLYQD